jgi:hypothetical protein
VSTSSLSSLSPPNMCAETTLTHLRLLFRQD